MKQLNLLAEKEPEVLKLYHGSKKGITGKIGPKSRSTCDFGAGFYMGTMREQAFSMVCGEEFPDHRFYNVSLNLTGLKTIQLDGLQWLFFILYNRQSQLHLSNTALHHSCLFESIARLRDSADVCIGQIADDKMPQAVNLFADNYLSDIGLYKALSAVQLGLQYVAITEKACSAIAVSEAIVTPSAIKELQQFDYDYRIKSQQAFEMAQKNYRRIGSFFDEYCEELGGKDISDLPGDWEAIVRRYSR